VGSAQDLTPRFYWPAPEGARVLVLGYAHTSGDVLFDPSIPLQGVDASTNTFILAYLQTLSLAGRTTNLLIELPYSWGTTEGRIIGILPAKSEYSGMNDAGITLAINLLGAPSMTASDFEALRAKPRPILGASIKIIPPTGSFDPKRLVNIGANRWATRLELGSIFPIRPGWLFELDAGVWLFGEDEDYLTGPRQQDPVYEVEMNLVRRFKPGFWASVDFNYFTGGRQTIGGTKLEDTQENSRIGATIAFPVAKRQMIKMGYSVGVKTQFGSNFNQFLVTYQVLLP
jgi:hypothetical protein